MLCEEDSEEVKTRYHLTKVESSFGEDPADVSTPADSSSGDQKAKKVEVKTEGRKSQEQSRQSCDGAARNTVQENNRKRRPLFLVAGHMATLNPQKMTDFAGSQLEGTLCSDEMVRVEQSPNYLGFLHCIALLPQQCLR